MKIRNGFVSNSSSSSFIISVPKGTELTTEAFHQLFFGDDTERILSEYCYSESSKVSVGRLVNDLINLGVAKGNDSHELQGKLTDPENQLLDIIDLNFDDFIEIHEKYYPRNCPMELYEDKEVRNAYNSDVLEAKKVILKAYLERHSIENDFYVVEYSDNDGPVGTFMEHGPLFRSSLVVRVNHH